MHYYSHQKLLKQSLVEFSLIIVETLADALQQVVS